MPRFRAAVEIHFKPGVFDPAGQAVANALTQLGHGGVGSVRVGKHLLVALDAADAAAAEREVDAMCRELLANPVIETYRVRVEAGSEADGAPPAAAGSATGAAAEQPQSSAPAAAQPQPHPTATARPNPVTAQPQPAAVQPHPAPAPAAQPNAAAPTPGGGRG